MPTLDATGAQVVHPGFVDSILVDVDEPEFSAVVCIESHSLRPRGRTNVANPAALLLLIHDVDCLQALIDCQRFPKRFAIGGTDTVMWMAETTHLARGSLEGLSNCDRNRVADHVIKHFGTCNRCSYSCFSASSVLLQILFLVCMF